jgi:hypothetical protein
MGTRQGFIHLVDMQVQKTTVDGERFIHNILWIVVQRQIEHAKEKPQGAYYDCLAAMVFASHALEAYLNFVGERLAPVFWKDEREYFRRTGFAGKVRKILELCGIPEPDKDNRPYCTIWQLKKLRDSMLTRKPKNSPRRLITRSMKCQRSTEHLST